ncbi:dihydrolipoyl dehydrogenase [Acuticoccus sediminis]|uniref:Dihydrolipoyl dehydrogenase n=1 Tax=Acuticoccus sediminis TaxID=2184697 RepID=A0A8B2NGE1_9HYPH|nr:dihydrolipoyl dehydrogenase [Acuticoccus sediminis]RAH98201.1 dihydrolipoyl dehydrogenase [Acuticoccus sediminis]
MDERAVDVAIIGAGTAGLAAFREARKVTDDIVLIDAGPSGTTCARVGCMPSKLLIAAANAAAHVREASAFGITCGDVAVDGAKVMERVRRYRDRFVDAVLEGLHAIPAEMRLKGTARFMADHLLTVTGEDRTVLVEAKRIVVATGSAPVVPPAFVHSAPQTSDDLFDWPDLPASVAVFGTGIIGLELGQALARLGVRVRLFGKGEGLGPLTDEAVSAAAREHLGASMEVVPDHELVNISGNMQGVTVEYRVDGRTYSATFERMLVAVGRAPNVSDLNLAATSLSLDEDGVPHFDRETGRCGDGPIYIAGDAMDDAPLLHIAEESGMAAGRNAALGRPVPTMRPVPLAIVFCEPQMALVGETHRELVGRGAAFAVGSVDFSDQGRALVMGEAAGRMSLYVEVGTGALLGAEMFAPRAEHMAHLLALALTEGLTVPELLEMPFYHPTFEEGLRTALQDALAVLRRMGDGASSRHLAADAPA